MTTDNSITESQEFHRATASTANGPVPETPQRTERPNHTGQDLQRAEIRGGVQTGRTINSAGRASSADINSHVQGNPFSSVRHERTKSPISIHEATPESIVELPSGATLTLGSAIRGGLVQRQGDGYIVVGESGGRPRQSHGQQQRPQSSLRVPGDGSEESDQPGEGEQEEEQEQHDDLKMESLGDDIERPMADLVERTSADSQIDAVKDVAETGQISENTMNALASQLGVEPSQLQEQVQPMMDAFHAQATKAIESAGVVDVDHFVEWAQENKGQAFQEAMHKHGTLRNTQAYRPLATEYVQNLDQINPDMVMNAELGPNVSMRKAQDGQIILTTPDGEMPWSTAVRSGLIKLSKRQGN